MQQINNFRISLKFTLRWEVGNASNGGYTNDPSDPGGETKWGISKRWHPSLDIQNLTPEQAAQIYADEYWDASGCDALELPLCTAVFDTSVHVGVPLSRTWLRTAADIDAFLNSRKVYEVGLVTKKPSNQKYLAGWLNRMSDLQKFCELNSPTPDPVEVPRWGSLG